MSALKELYTQISGCFKCEIARSRCRAVPGEGPENAEIMFIGEAPGWNEDQQGRPFVGAAGQFLDRLIESIGLTRQQVYIANVIKCRPGGNRDPLPTEIENCAPFLEKQIELIQPRMIVTLGRFSMAKFFPGKTIGRIHGTARIEGGRAYFAMYHPAAALHQQSLRKEIEADMLKIPGILADLGSIKEITPQAQPQQLSLFSDVQ